MTRNGTTVLNIVGYGRSGSTLLDLVLGQLPGFTSVGELTFLWERGVIGNQLCGCGEPFGDCRFWQDVGGEAFGGWERVDAAAMLSLKRSVERQRLIPLMAAPRVARRYQARLGTYADVLRTVYEAVRTVAGARVVVDSSKLPSNAFLLRRVPGLDVRYAHLVRDSRGVAFSWQRRVVRPEITGSTTYMPRYGALRASAEWAFHNLLLHSLGGRRALLTYENLVRDPRRNVASVLEQLGLPAADHDLAFIGPDSVDLEPTHSVAGNPMRFVHGPVELRLDEDWRAGMRPGSRRLVSALTWPLLGRYGYLTRSESGA
jgi:hypothetical protein